MIERLLVLLPLVCAGAALGQEPQTPPAAAAGVNPTLGAPWDGIAVPLTERRYKVEAIRFKARDETGVDWLGSDEVMVETDDPKGFTVTDEIGDIDSGDVHAFDPEASCIIGVPEGRFTLGKTSVCDARGEPGPFQFEVVFWEKDSFAFDIGFCAPVGPPPGMHIGEHCGNDHRGDDFIGRRELYFPAPELEATLPNVGDTYTETVVLNACEDGESACGGWDLPDYSFTYRTTRLPDVRTDFRSELLAAMKRSAIPLAGDAVAAGLRALAVPVSRQAEAEPAAPTLAED